MLSAVIRSALGYPAFTVGTITGTPELTYRFNGRTAQPLEHTTAPGGEEPTSSCAGKAQSQSQGTVKLHRVFLSRCRQCPDRYAFRAGRNLPDKEFRYLRTVIVTAAVHRGFGRRLPCHQVPSCSKSFELFLGVWHGLLQRRSAWYSNIGSRHAVRALAPPTAWELTVSCSISLPDGGSFHPSLTVLLRYRSPRTYNFHRTVLSKEQLFSKSHSKGNESLPFSDPDCPT
ncbi:unnamed protein product [Withania somnifera]